MCLRSVLCSRLAGTELLIDFLESVLAVCCIILFEGSCDKLVSAEKLDDLAVSLKTVFIAESADKGSHRKLSVLIYTDKENIVCIVFIFKPCASVRDNSCAEKLVSVFIVIHLIVNARRTNQLGNDDSLGAVDNKCTAGSHKREIAHKDIIMILYLAVRLCQPYHDLERR